MTERVNPNLEPGWLAQLAGEFEQPYRRQLRDFLRQCKAERRVIYPRSAECVNALALAPPGVYLRRLVSGGRA